jgi:predicted nucleotidyltransferase
MLADDPVLARFRKALDEMYGDRIDRVVLFGSRAWDDARIDSDYDVAVFLKSLPDRWAELDRLAALRVEMIDETGAFFDAKPYLATAYPERTPLMHEIRQDGTDLLRRRRTSTWQSPRITRAC